MFWEKMSVLAIPVIALACGVAQANSLVSNGSFENFTGGFGGAPSELTSFGIPALSGPGYTDLTDWTNSGYTYLFAPGTADTTGSYSQQYSVPLYLWGPGNGSVNGLPLTSPDGGNFLASDPSYQTGTIQQTISGLTVGDTYVVGFWWAGAQQEADGGSQYNGPTTEGWQVSLGSDTQSTVIANNTNHGFTGWMYQTFDFKATTGSEVLSFLALGGPSSSVPPFALLDGVTVTAPLPTSLSLGAVGIVGLAAVSLRRRAKSVRA